MSSSKSSSSKNPVPPTKKIIITPFIHPSKEEQSDIQSIRDSLLSEEDKFPLVKNETILTDVAILRFYRGRRRKKDDAMQAIQSYFAWRTTFQVDDIFKNTHLYEKELKKKLFTIRSTVDSDKRPVIFLHPHHHNSNDRDIEELRYLMIFMLESLVKMSNPEEERAIYVVVPLYNIS